MNKIIRAKSPMRISFAGGGTDVSPFIEEQGGAVINATINRYAYVTLIPRSDHTVIVHTMNSSADTQFDLSNGSINYDGSHNLLKAAVKVLNIDQGFEIIEHIDAEPGTGLGSSSTLTTAKIGVFNSWLNLHLDEYQLAALAYQIERVEANMLGGKQDQYATVFGGVNFIEFSSDKTVVNQLKIKQSVLDELEYRLILCDTKRSRVSSEIIGDQVKSYIDGNADVVSALIETKKIAREIKDALVLGDIDQIGQMLHRGWELKKKFSSKMTNTDIDRLYAHALENGAIGGKLLGAGGGGHMLFLCKRELRCNLVEKMGDLIKPFSFEFRGLHTWQVK